VVAAPQRGAICFLRTGQIVQLKDLAESGTGDIDVIKQRLRPRVGKLAAGIQIKEWRRQ